MHVFNEVSIDVNVHDRHILLIYEKCNFQELKIPFVRVLPPVFFFFFFLPQTVVLFKIIIAILFARLFTYLFAYLICLFDACLPE